MTSDRDRAEMTASAKARKRRVSRADHAFPCFQAGVRPNNERSFVPIKSEQPPVEQHANRCPPGALGDEVGGSFAQNGGCLSDELLRVLL